MTKIQAIRVVENMPEQEFQVFFKSLPNRVQMLVRSGMTDWKSTLADWYMDNHK